jgi:hypothetical protein
MGAHGSFWTGLSGPVGVMVTGVGLGTVREELPSTGSLGCPVNGRVTQVGRAGGGTGIESVGVRVRNVGRHT